jgi:DNA-binding NarL/FixJ family response regulator
MGASPEENPVRLLIVEHHGLLRDSLCRFLASQNGFQLVGECGTPEEALDLLPAAGPDVVLLEFETGSSGGTEFIAKALDSGYRGRFLLVAEGEDTHATAVALRLGASGVFLKSEALDRLVQAIHFVSGGEIWIDAKIIRALADRLLEREAQVAWDRSDPRLEEREREVLRGIVGGLTNKKIGSAMGLSESTVKNTVQKLFLKIGVKTRSQLVRAALEAESLTKT